MKKVYYLATCSTCKRIMHELGRLLDGFEQQDIKNQPITLDQIDEMKNRSGSYEALFSRKAIKFKSLDLGEKVLTEMDYRKLIHDEYTFLKRPVFLVNDRIFIGNSNKIIDSLKEHLG